MVGEQTYRVEGMTCGHCVAAVREEVGAVEGVASVDVDLEGGVVTVRGEAVPDAAVAAAVEEAGYRVVAGRS
ncbi:MAG: heavy-metal-associated domain-containing protein [Thermoleophilia bacterium]|nr:heavy-metal-associated domain-containing protein [Thermoleophilia bacterium]